MKHPEPLLLPVGPVMDGGSMTDKVALAKAIHKERKRLFSPQEVPLSKEVIRRQFGEAVKRYRGQNISE